MRKRCIDCREVKEVYGQICPECVRGYYRREKNRSYCMTSFHLGVVSTPVQEPRPGTPAGAVGGGNLVKSDNKDCPIEQTPRVRARACLYFRPANVTFSESEQ